MLTKLKEIVQEIGQIPVLDEALACVAHRLVEVMNISCCSIYLADYQNKVFELVATDGLSADSVGKVSIGFSEGLIGFVGQKGEPINVPDAQTHWRYKHIPEVEEEAYHGFLGTPIIHQRQVLGVITIQDKQTRKFGEEEEAFLVTLAAQMALEIANAEVRGVIRVNEPRHLGKKRQSVIFGVPGSPGLNIGLGLVPEDRIQLKDYVLQRSDDISEDIAVYREAVLATKDDIQELTERIAGTVPQDVASIFQLYEQLLDANSLGNEVESKILEGWNAPSALKLVVEGYRNQFAMMSDPYMKERAIDVEDLGGRVFAYLVNDKVVPEVDVDSIILVAETVTAAMLAEYPMEKLKGIISLRGSGNSHTAIMARAMGIPAVMGLSDVPLAVFNRYPILIDGYSGTIRVNPEEAELKRFKRLIVEEQELERIIAQYADLCAITRDGEPLELLINAGLSADLDASYLALGDGIGLYRTEIPFMQKERFPSEQEQVNLYRTMLKAYPNKSVTMRTLDVGGDKPLPYLSYEEDNPFLGWRGIRLTLDHPEIFIVQVRAMLRASIGFSNLRIMLPMITSVSEVKESKRLINQAFSEVQDEWLAEGEVLKRPEIGVMIEVPATVYQIPALAEQVDFFSVGTNDLIQYLLAVDRNNPRVSSIYNNLHPAVLAVLKQIIDQANAVDTPVTLCGELGADPAAIILLLAMGYRKLSVNGHNLAKVKWVVSQIDIVEAQRILDDVLKQPDSLEIGEILNLELENMGLGGLVRAGK
ncbi:phosphoenolpyruvate--protein phosphotransferase [Alteromonas sp. a30]|uniref:phosphoenolpyruvate--protein phosphotransferase n=1 Tax=Alteromonas sp. a30 TaxID=2730917 RepID=UPI00227FF041|nr:phosphoenolpyruvate--protein phosphotransferase [Alteromonas sp. a30]MCY7294272.1 phosphoenolpyruvate--protein phosphotransferase [Alteromonas sp. a30]